MPYYNKEAKRDHNFDNHPYDIQGLGHLSQTKGPMLGFRKVSRGPHCCSYGCFDNLCVLHVGVLVMREPYYVGSMSGPLILGILGRALENSDLRGVLIRSSPMACQILFASAFTCENPLRQGRLQQFTILIYEYSIV